MSVYYSEKDNYHQKAGTNHCKACTKPFTPKRGWQTFCSEPCRQYHARKQKELESLKLELKVKELEDYIEKLETANKLLKAKLDAYSDN